jgi:hypothetical protein
MITQKRRLEQPEISKGEVGGPREYLVLWFLSMIGWLRYEDNRRSRNLSKSVVTRKETN